MHGFRGTALLHVTLTVEPHVIVPRHRRTIFGRRAFTVAGPTAWNSLLDYLRDPSLSEDTFRRLLKTCIPVCVVLVHARIRGVAKCAL